jgi:gliding motility-associated-like protein
MRTILVVIMWFGWSGATIAQNTCNSALSFRINSGSWTKVLPSGTGSYNQLYDKKGFTWEAWIRLRAPITQQCAIISVEDEAIYQNIKFGFGWGNPPDAPHLSMFVFDDGTANVGVYAESPQSLQIGTWHHVATICDYDFARLTLLIDGVVVESVIMPQAITSHRLAVNRTVQIGNLSSWAQIDEDFGFDADIDEVRIWRGARKVQQIAEQRFLCMPTDTTGLVAYFKADEGGGMTSVNAVNAQYSLALVQTNWTDGIPDVPNCMPNPPVHIRDTICSDASYGNYTMTGIYTDYFTTAAGCDSTRVLDLVVLPPISAQISRQICAGEQYNGHTASGIYVDTLRSSKGCDSVVVTTLTVLAERISNFNVQICAGQAYEGYTESGTYTDRFRLPTGCDSTRTVKITVNNEAASITPYVPNAFAPNSSGDCFRPIFKAGTQLIDYQLYVYDRWGTLCFTTDQLGDCWDGTHNGKKYPIGVYVYWLSYQTPYCDPVVLKGDIMLVE